MKPFRIHRPTFEKNVSSKEEYSLEMQKHLQSLEDFYKMLGEIEGEGWGIGQMWAMEHKDGRVARLPDVCPYERIKKEAEEREKTFLDKYKKKTDKQIKKQEMEMTEKNIFNGAVLFDGNITVNVKGGRKLTLRTDYLGAAIKSADPNKEIVILLHSEANYNELRTGYIERRDVWEQEDERVFGLSPNHDKTLFYIFPYSDVIAWGYADGGLNDESMFYSCQCTKDQEKELQHAREVLGIKPRKRRVWKDTDRKNDGTIIKFQNDGDEVRVQIVTAKDKIEDYIVASRKHLAPCMQNFIDFTKDNKDICEIQYFTKPTAWEEE